MPKFRIEIEEQGTVHRETWIVAADADEAQEKAEALDWRTFSEVDNDLESRIIAVELCEE